MSVHAFKLTAEESETSADNKGAPASVMTTPAPRLALIIPTLREAENIRVVLDRVRASLDPLGMTYEILIVDDDSGDGIEAIVAEIAAEDPRVRLLVRKGERGLGGAVLHGWKHSDADVLGVIDADLQHPPELLPRLWQAVESGSDVVLASRYAPQGGLDNWHPVRHLLSRAAIWMTYPLQNKNIRVQDPMAGFFMVRRSSLREVELHNKGFKILLEILVRGKVNSVTEVPFTFGPRRAGTSKANLAVGLDYFGLLWRLWRER
jgi:dolichol-phosphate mannosyltransferase